MALRSQVSVGGGRSSDNNKDTNKANTTALSRREQEFTSSTCERARSAVSGAGWKHTERGLPGPRAVG